MWGFEQILSNNKNYLKGVVVFAFCWIYSNLQLTLLNLGRRIRKCTFSKHFIVQKLLFICPGLKFMNPVVSLREEVAKTLCDEISCELNYWEITRRVFWLRLLWSDKNGVVLCGLSSLTRWLKVENMPFVVQGEQPQKGREHQHLTDNSETMKINRIPITAIFTII